MDTMNMMSLKLIYLTADHEVKFAFLELEREQVEAKALRLFLHNTVQLSLAWTPLLALLISNQHAKT